jgi:transposase
MCKSCWATPGIWANVPGRKTDISDAQWIAKLLRHGLIRPSFVPPRAIRDLRQITRYRRKLVQSRTSAELRVEKLLQTTNIKLSSVASEVFGVSGRLMLSALACGITDPVKLAGLAKGKLRNKQIELTRAFRGSFTLDDARLLDAELCVIDDVEKTLSTINQLLGEKVTPFEDEIARLDTVPGIDRTLAIDLIAEIGTDLSAWPTARHFAAWTGTCPGNRESAGVRRTARVRDGNRYVKTVLTQAAVCASRTVTSYLAARYRRLVPRRGQRRAIVALAHEIAVSIYHMLRNGQPYIPPRIADPQKLREHRRKQLIRDLNKLGFEVTCTPSK